MDYNQHIISYILILKDLIYTRFFPVTFLGVLSDLFRGENVTSIWVIKRSLGRSWYIYIPRKSKDQTLPLGSRESFTWIILKTILCLVLDFQGIYKLVLRTLPNLNIKTSPTTISQLPAPPLWAPTPWAPKNHMGSEEIPGVPSLKLTFSPLKIPMFPCKYHQNGGFSMAMLHIPYMDLELVTHLLSEIVVLLL